MNESPFVSGGELSTEWVVGTFAVSCFVRLAAFFCCPAGLSVLAEIYCAFHSRQVDGAGELISKPIAFLMLGAAQVNFLSARPAVQFSLQDFTFVFAG